MSETIRSRHVDAESDVGGGSVQVLHVEDDPDFAAVAADALEAADDRISVVTAISAESALSQLGDGEFDAVVSDYDMPEMNGIELLDAIREKYPELPFILFTGKGSEEVASDAISMGVTDYLQKSFGTEVYELLANRIENAVSEYRAKRQAAESERRIRELTEATNDILWVFTADLSEVLVINSAYEDIWGRSVADLRDEPHDFLNGIHPEDRGAVKDGMQSLLNGESVDVECRVNAEEGYRRWVWIQGEPITDDTGETCRVAGFARDITERRSRERELAETRERMERALETTNTIIWERDIETDTLTYYPSSETLYDTGIETLEDFLAQIHPDDQPDVRARLKTAAETGEYQSITSTAA